MAETMGKELGKKMGVQHNTTWVKRCKELSCLYLELNMANSITCHIHLE